MWMDTELLIFRYLAASIAIQLCIFGAGSIFFFSSEKTPPDSVKLQTIPIFGAFCANSECIFCVCVENQIPMRAPGAPVHPANVKYELLFFVCVAKCWNEVLHWNRSFGILCHLSILILGLNENETCYLYTFRRLFRIMHKCHCGKKSCIFLCLNSAAF